MDPFEKSTTVDPEVRAYISSLVNAVGGSSTSSNSYQVGDDALAVLKDLQRWLRLYDEKTNRLDVKRCLAEANLVQNDLLEIFSLWSENVENKHRAKLALAGLELLVPLTWPLALEDEKATINHHRHVPYLQLAQVAYKRAVLHFEFAKILSIAARAALPAMAQPRRERNSRDEGIIKLVLYFFRNMAMITQLQHLPSQGDENDISRSATIEAFHEQEIFAFLLTIGSGADDAFQEQDVVLLEILFHILKGVDAKKLFLEKEQVATEETQELRMLLRKEKAMVNDYNKHAPTRHNRFGTMIWVKRDEMKMSTVSGQATIGSESTTLYRMDSTKRWNKPRYRGKLGPEFDENSDLGGRTQLTESAKRHLRDFVEDFLDSSFNPLFASLRKAIEREAERVQTSMHPKQYFYLISWFLNAESARQDLVHRKAADTPERAQPGSNNFAHIAAVLDQETFVLLNRQMQNAFDNKIWQDLQATLQCFTQILLTVQSMAASKDEEDQEIAENIQNRIFYEESTHDRILQILRGYTHQGFAYLDVVTECVHVFIRMLERYSKQNVDLHIRSKKRARKKQKQQLNNQDAGHDAEEQNEDVREARRTVSERKFDFERFSSKFLSQPCVNTFVALMHFHWDLTAGQLKRAHRFFHRLAFKHGLAVLLFRADVLQLLHKLIKGPEGLDPEMEGFHDWEQLVQHVFRRCIKWIERDVAGEGWKEAAVVEMLFSKIPNTLFYLQNGYERVIEKKQPRPPAELELKANVPEEEKIGVTVSAMIEQAKSDSLGWVKKQLETAAAQRRAWEDEQGIRQATMHAEEDGTAPEVQSAPSFILTPDSEDRKSALFRDKYLRLLLATLGIQRLGLAEDDDAMWTIPPEATAATLEEILDTIKKVEFNPSSFENDKKAVDFIRSKSAARRTANFDPSDSEEDMGGPLDLDDEIFPPNLPEKRRKRQTSDEERPKKRRRQNAPETSEEELAAKRKLREQKEREKNAKIKSKLFVTSSDDESDEERDAEFFRLEDERRTRTDGIIRNMLLKQKKPAETKTKSKKSADALIGEQAIPVSDRLGISDDETDAERSLSAFPPLVLRNRRIEISDDDSSSSERDEDENTGEEGNEESPSTTPTRGEQPLKEASGNSRFAADSDSEEEDREQPISKPGTRRKARAGFIVEDSDDE